MSLGPLYVFLGEVSVQVLCPFFNWVVCLPGVESCEFFIRIYSFRCDLGERGSRWLRKFPLTEMGKPAEEAGLWSTCKPRRKRGHHHKKKTMLISKKDTQTPTTSTALLFLCFHDSFHFIFIFIPSSQIGIANTGWLTYDRHHNKHFAGIISLNPHSTPE